MTQFRTPDEAKPGRRRLVGVGATQPQPEPLQAFDDADSDPTFPPLPKIVSHPLSYAEGLPARWRSQLCLVDKYDRDTVQGWDATEAEIRRDHAVSRVEIVVLKHTSRNWESAGRMDGSLTENELYAALGPGAYSFMAYAIIVDDGTGQENERLMRQFGHRLLPRPQTPTAQHAAPVPAAAAPPPPASPPVSFGGVGMPAPTSFAEWAAYQQLEVQRKQVETEAEERRRQRELEAEERRRQRDLENDQRREDKRRADLMHQQQFDAMMAQRSRELEASTEAREDRKAERDRERIENIKSLEQKAASAATTDPVEKLKVGMDAIAEAKALLGVDDGERNVSSIERVFGLVSNVMQGHGEKIFGILDTLVTNRAKLAELEAYVMRDMQAKRAQPQPVRAVAAAPIANPAPRAPAPPPAPAAAPPAAEPAPVVETAPSVAEAPAEPSIDGEWTEPAAEIISETIDTPAPETAQDSGIVVAPSMVVLEGYLTGVSVPEAAFEGFMDDLSPSANVVCPYPGCGKIVGADLEHWPADADEDDDDDEEEEGAGEAEIDEQ